jgi:hypothetical protein
VLLTGPGWTGWDDSASLRDNLESCGRTIRAILWYKPERCVEPGEHPCPATVCYNEAWWPDWRAARECVASRVERVVCHHMEDLPRMQAPPEVLGGHAYKLYHLPHAADSAAFARHSRLWSERDIPCLVWGALSPEFYPLRCRFAKMVRSGFVPGQVLNHPGYRLANLEACDRQKERYAAMLGRTKLALVCSSIYRYGLAKYVEAAAAGCCVVGDAPPDFAETIGQGMVGIDPNASDDTILHVVRSALANDVDSLDRARACQAAARRWHGMRRYAECLKNILSGVY